MTTHKDEQQAYEDRLQRRLQILLKQLEAGKVKFAEGLGVVESLKKVRYALDGTVDLSTVDGLVRSMALAVEHIHDREELKETISLGDIQNSYFGFIKRNFDQFYRIMLERGLSPHEAGVALSRNPETAKEITNGLPEFLNTLYEFWQQVGDAAHAHVEDMHHSLKAIFGGDLFPSHAENIASKCGIYTDTIVLPDPFLRSRHLFERWTVEKKAYYLVKHGLNLLQYSELACADLSLPIVVVLPDVTTLEEDEQEFILNLSRRDVVTHAGKVFGRCFASVDELMEFSRRLDTVELAAAAVSDPQRLLFDVEWKGSVLEQISKAAGGVEAGLLGSRHPGLIIASSAIGRMATANELLIKARRLRGTPIIDAPTSWQYFVWKLEYDARDAEQDFHVGNLHVLRGLQNLAEGEMEWLGNVPPEALIEIRKTGALEEIRAVLGRGVEELATANPDNFYRTTDQVFGNIYSAFKDHRRKVDDLTAKKWRFAGSDIGSWLVVGSLAITAAATGTPVWGLAAIAADQLLDAPKLRDIPKSIKQLANETQQLKRSPVGVLFEYSR
jgi:hypothetical protein